MGLWFSPDSFMGYDHPITNCAMCGKEEKLDRWGKTPDGWLELNLGADRILLLCSWDCVINVARRMKKDLTP